MSSLQPPQADELSALKATLAAQSEELFLLKTSHLTDLAEAESKHREDSQKAKSEAEQMKVKDRQPVLSDSHRAKQLGGRPNTTNRPHRRRTPRAKYSSSSPTAPARSESSPSPSSASASRSVSLR